MSAAEVVQEDALTLLERERRTSAALRDELAAAERQCEQYERMLKRVVDMGRVLREDIDGLALVPRETADGGLSLLVGIARQAL